MHRGVPPEIAGARAPPEVGGAPPEIGHHQRRRQHLWMVIAYHALPPTTDFIGGICGQSPLATAKATSGICGWAPISGWCSSPPRTADTTAATCGSSPLTATTPPPQPWPAGGHCAPPSLGRHVAFVNAILWKRFKTVVIMNCALYKIFNERLYLQVVGALQISNHISKVNESWAIKESLYKQHTNQNPEKYLCCYLYFQ